MNQGLIDPYDDHGHEHFNRRLFLDRAVKIVGIGGALSAMPVLQSDYAQAAIVAEDDPRIATQWVNVPVESGDLRAYLAKPTRRTKHPGVLVVHDNRGLNLHIEDIARRLAVEGYAALAVDFLSPLGGTPADEATAMKMFADLDDHKVRENSGAALKWLGSRLYVDGSVGAVGFGWGGGVVIRLAANNRMLSAGVVYYGLPPDLTAVRQITAKLLLNYADTTLDVPNGDILPAYEAALKAAGIRYELFVYEGAEPGFDDDTIAARYNEAAATLAWSRMLAVFKSQLGMIGDIIDIHRLRVGSNFGIR